MFTVCISPRFLGNSYLSRWAAETCHTKCEVQNHQKKHKLLWTSPAYSRVSACLSQWAITILHEWPEALVRRFRSPGPNLLLLLGNGAVVESLDCACALFDPPWVSAALRTKSPAEGKWTRVINRRTIKTAQWKRVSLWTKRTSLCFFFFYPSISSPTLVPSDRRGRQTPELNRCYCDCVLSGCGATHV